MRSATCELNSLAIAACCWKRLARVLEPGRVVDHEACRLEVGRHLGELELHALELRDRLAELLALLHVRGRGLERAASPTPIIWAPMPMRPSFSVSIAIL